MKRIPESKNSVQYSLTDSSISLHSATCVWWEQFLYLLDSMAGKYSFTTYLEIMSEFIDEEIRRERELRYTGGRVVFSADVDHPDCDIQVELFFIHPESNKYSVKRAQRRIPKSKFIRRDIALLEKQKKLEFNVEKPED